MKTLILFIFLLVQLNKAEYQDEPQVCTDPNEELKTCGTACEPTCANTDPICTKQCINNVCQCKKDYIRKSTKDNTCVKKSACKGSSESETCANKQCNFGQACIQRQIFCFTAPCPQPPPECVGPDDPDYNYGCGQNEKRFQCGTACEPSCKNPEPQICTLQCLVNVCQCIDGTYRDETTNKCVEKCTKTTGTGPREIVNGPRSCADTVCYPGFDCYQPTINCVTTPCPQPNAQCVPKGWSGGHPKTNIVPYTGTSSQVNVVSQSNSNNAASSYSQTITKIVNGKTVTYTNNNGKKTVTHSKGGQTVTSNSHTSNGGGISSTSVRITSTSGGSDKYPTPPAPPKKKCGKNEFFDECGACSDRCEDKGLFCICSNIKLCPTLCLPDRAGCSCVPGFRRSNGKCIPEGDCPAPTPQPTCGPNEFFNLCARGCPDDCSRMGKPCPDICIGPAACSCRPRLCRRTPGGPCVAPPPGPPTGQGPSTPGPPTPSPGTGYPIKGEKGKSGCEHESDGNDKRKKAKKV